MKRIITKVKHPVDGLNIRMEKVEERIIGLKLEQQTLPNVTLIEKIDIKFLSENSAAFGTITKSYHVCHQSPKKKGD